MPLTILSPVISTPSILPVSSNSESSSLFSRSVNKVFNTSQQLPLPSGGELKSEEINKQNTLGKNVKKTANFAGAVKTVIADNKQKAQEAGEIVRRVVSVRSIQPGIIHTRIKHNDQNLMFADHSRLSQIMANVQKDAQYDSLLTINSRSNVDVLAIKDGQAPTKPSSIIQGNAIRKGTTFINGGFFVHRDGLKTTNGIPAPIGYTVGETKGKENTIPVPNMWKTDYGTLTDKDGQIILTSAPILKSESEFTGNRFTYFIDSEKTPNKLNTYAGSLTHSSNRNERAAITLNNDNSVRMHTITTKGGDRDLGMTMKQWNNTVSTMSTPNDESLNLDGAASIAMGFIEGDKITKISKGGGENSKERDLADIVITSR